MKESYTGAQDQVRISQDIYRFEAVNRGMDFSYGVNVYQVVAVTMGYRGIDFDEANAMGLTRVEYETTSMAKAKAVAEYLTIKQGIQNIDQNRVSPELGGNQGCIVADSIKSS